MADNLIIKPDPDAKGGASPAAFKDEEDIYEDAGDLEFNTIPEYQELYLAKVPKYVWDAWSKLDDDAEIQIGTIRRSLEVTAKGEKREKLQMLLSDNLAVHQSVAKEYELDVTAENVVNTFVFTEQDLPGFKSRAQAKFDPSSANMPARLTRPAKIEKSKLPYDPNRKFTPYFKRAIPKRTTLAGRIKHEINCIEVDNEESQRLLAIRTSEAMKPKHLTKFIHDDIATNNSAYVQPGTLGAMNAFGGFIKTKGAVAGNRPQLSKAARMPENELLDKIFECFRRYKYWSMKALRAELQQPEAYLRETLEKVAVLARSGPFATQWSLTAGNTSQNYAGGDDAMAPDASFAEESDTGMDDDDEDDDMKFEDVVPS